MKEQEQAKILVIDDDVTVRKSHEAVLKANGYEVDVAETERKQSRNPERNSTT